jgi:hypothetical protein
MFIGEKEVAAMITNDGGGLGRHSGGRGQNSVCCTIR